MSTPIVEGVNTNETGDESHSLSGQQSEDSTVLLVTQIHPLRPRR